MVIAIIVWALVKYRWQQLVAVDGIHAPELRRSSNDPWVGRVFTRPFLGVKFPVIDID